jgi:hypothetical protein
MAKRKLVKGLLNSQEHTRKGPKVATKTAVNRSHKQVTLGSQNRIFQEPKNVAQTWGHLDSILTPHVLIFAQFWPPTGPFLVEKCTFLGRYSLQ